MKVAVIELKQYPDNPPDYRWYAAGHSGETKTEAVADAVSEIADEIRGGREVIAIVVVEED